MNDSAIGAGIAFLSAFAGTMAIRHLALRLGILSAPNPIVSQHDRPVAYLGGLGVLVGLLAGLAWIDRSAVGIASGILLFAMLGTFDDARPLAPLPKAVLQGFAALLSVGAGLSGALTGAPVVDAFLSAMLIFLCVNAFNVTDVSDGLVAVIVAGTAAGWATAAMPNAWLAWLLVAAFLGFLPFNWPRATIFLGDGGSHLAGFGIAALALSAAEAALPLRLEQMLLLAAIPLFEVAFIVTLRRRKGLPWWRGSPDHFALRLQRAGWSRAAINLGCASLAFVFGLVSAQLTVWPMWVAAVVLAALLALASAAARYLVCHEAVHA